MFAWARIAAPSVQPLVAVGVVEVPVRVDQMPDRLGTEACQRLGDLRPRAGNAGVDEELAVRAGEDRDVAARTHQHTDPAAQAMHGDLRRACVLRIWSTMLRAWAKASCGVSQRPVATKVADARQHRQMPRRDVK